MLRGRLGALPEAVAGIPGSAAAPILHIPDVTPTLGMCGVLRPVSNFSPVGPAPAAGPVRK
ncbi:MAG: hypothetical protein MUE80_03210 [Acidobacteria bacterium]|nr:hypothetical protein [Acidobacteriota bacterium]